MTLTDTAIRNAKPKAKRYKLFDERGLFLLVDTTGGKWWRFRYQSKGKHEEISLGIYPEISLRAARDARDEHRAQLRKTLTRVHTARRSRKPV